MAVSGSGAASASVSVAVAASVMAATALPVTGSQPVAVHESDNGSYKEQNNVNNRKHPARLEHGTRLIGLPVVIGSSNGNVSQASGPVGIAIDVGAVKIADIS